MTIRKVERSERIRHEDSKLSTEDIAVLAELENREWDKQIESDLDSGRLDSLVAEAAAEYRA